jgi:hypothetical protein
MAEKKTTSEKIEMCIRYLRHHGYGVITPNTMQSSIEAVRKNEEQRSRILNLGGASLVTLLTSKDVADMIGTTPKTLGYYLEKRGLPQPVIGGASGFGPRKKGQTNRRWRLEDIQGYLKTFEKGATPETKKET